MASSARAAGRCRPQPGWQRLDGSYPNYLDIRARNTVFTDIYAYKLGAEPMSLGGADGAERIFGDMVSTNYFDVLGARPQIGRLFASTDGNQPGATPFAVLSHQFWKRRFNGDPAVVGRTLQVNGHPLTVIGVAPDGFHGTTVLTTDVWVPITMVGELSPRRSGSILTSRESVWIVMGARLKPGVSIGQAQGELTSIARALEQEYPDANHGKGLRVAASAPIPGNGAPVAAFMAVLMGIVTLVLAIACAHVAGCCWRASARRRSRSAWRSAPARPAHSPGRRCRCWLLSAELGLAPRAVDDGAGLALPALPLPIDVSLPLDARTVGFTLALSLGAAVLSGLAPRSTRHARRWSVG
jgi:hypothetical protein